MASTSLLVTRSLPRNVLCSTWSTTSRPSTSRLSIVNQHRASRRRNSSTTPQQQVFEHPQYEGLYYHRIDSNSDEPAFALSFLSSPPPLQAPLSSLPSIIGILRRRSSSAAAATSNNGDDKQGGMPPLVPTNFQENKDFKTVLHDILRQAITFDEKLQTEAKNRGDGWIHIADARAPADLNRVPDPSDIVASVLCQQGHIVAESYEPGQMHRLVSIDGLMKLDTGLMNIVRQAFEQVRQIELQEANKQQ
ncbi:hypothetical protein OIO90_002956 [Microbotryomycetes sp. JL221]|nr:hypothetical protein OIO90_002956 [Microbotryomycetes sp. JL221]